MRECERPNDRHAISAGPATTDGDGMCKDETGGRCRMCGTHIGVRAHALPVCPARKCRRAWLGSSAAAAQCAIDLRMRTVVAECAGESGVYGRVVALLPANTRAMEPVTADLRERFVCTLRARLRDYPRDHAPDSPGTVDRSDPLTPDLLPLHPMLEQGCATCRGACCTRGGTHAFLSADRLRRTASENGLADTGAALEALYTAHLPTTHYTDSCVFHGERGCTLPRVLRSDTCNRYLCGGLSALNRALTGAPGETAVVGAATWSSIERIAVIDESGARSLPLSALTALSSGGSSQRRQGAPTAPRPA